MVKKTDRWHDFDFSKPISSEEYHEMEAGLVRPLFRSFCRSLDLPFHFWDELGEDTFDKEIAYEEMKPLLKAYNLFNSLKPEFSFFKGKVVRYRIHGGVLGSIEFAHSSVPIQEFLSKVADELFYLDQVRRRFENVCAAVVILCFFAVVTGVLGLMALLGTPPFWEATGGYEMYLPLGLALAAGYLMHRWLDRMPRRILEDGRLDGLEERLKELRSRLEQIRGSRPNPLKLAHELRLGRLIMDELNEMMTPEGIERLVRRLQSNLYIVPDDELGESEE